MKRALAIVLLSVAATAGRREARAQAPAEAVVPDYTFDGDTLRINDGGLVTTVDLGCAGRSALRSGAKLFVACGVAGVIELDMSDPAAPRRDGEMQVDGEATGLFLRAGRIWVEVASIDARPLRIDAHPAPPPLSTLPPLPPLEVPERHPAVSQTHAERASLPTTAARPETPTETPSVVAPPRRGDLWELSLLTSGFVSIGSLGGGVLGSASVAYRFKGPFVVRTEVAPYGIGGASNTTATTGGSTPIASPPGAGGFGTVFVQHQPPSITTAAAHFFAGIDTQFIEVAVGIGSATVNQNLGRLSSGRPDSSGLSIGESARIGARDGLAVSLESDAVAANGEFNLGFFNSTVQIPLSRTSMLMVRGGGGPVGYGYGDVGVRVLVHGNGEKGTIALTGFAGGAAIMLNLCSTNPLPPNTQECNALTLAGPSLGGALEWKL